MEEIARQTETIARHKETLAQMVDELNVQIDDVNFFLIQYEHAKRLGLKEYNRYSLKVSKRRGKKLAKKLGIKHFWNPN